MGRYSNWKQAVSDGQGFRKWKPLIQFCLGRVSFHHHVQLGLSQGFALGKKGKDILGGRGKTGLKDKITKVWEGEVPTRKLTRWAPVV